MDLNNLQPTEAFKKFVESGPFCRYFFEELLIKTFQGVGLENAKRMAPKNTHLQTMHAL